MRTNTKHIIACILINLTFSVFAQNEKKPEQNELDIIITESKLCLESTDEDSVLNCLQKLQLKYNTNLPSTEKQKILSTVLSFFYDERTGISGVAGKFILEHFVSEDFTPKIIDSIKTAINSKKNNRRDMLFLIAGLTLDTSFNPILESIVINSQDIVDYSRDYFYTQHWAAKKALARIGDNTAIDFVISAADRIEDLTFKHTVFMDITYISSYKLVDLYKRYLESDLILVGYGSKPIDTPFKYLVSLPITKIFIDFPFPYKRRVYCSKEDIEEIIKLLNSKNKYKLRR